MSNRTIEIPTEHREAIYESAVDLIECAADDVAQAARTESESLDEVGRTLAGFTSIRDQAFHATARRADVPASIDGELNHIRAVLCSLIVGETDPLNADAQSEFGYMDAPEPAAIAKAAEQAKRIAWACAELIGLTRDPVVA